jgi:ATP-dependent DNA helicase RecG
MCVNLAQLKRMVKNENIQTEFKSTTGELRQACQTLCAFLNDHGGWVFLGVKNDGRLVGQMVTDATRQEIANELRKFEPPVSIEVNYIPIEGEKFVIAMGASSGNHIPYVYDGRPYYRLESSTSVMPQHLYEQLIIKRGQLNHSWESFSAESYTIEDLDHDEIRKTIKQGIGANRIPGGVLNESIIDILSSLELLENKKLKNAAIVLYAKKVFPRYSQCMIKMARFRGLKETDDFMDNQQFYGNAFKILEEADHFMRRHLSIASFYQSDSFVRIDKPTLPVLAVREAIINAIIHRDYSQSGAAITLAIFDDRLEIWNNGFLPKELRIENLKEKHQSYLRNELIANTFFKRGFIEGWGTGIVKMFEQCREHGIPDPIFEQYSGGVSVQFIFEELIGPHAGAKNAKDPINKNIPVASAIESLSRRQLEILKILSGTEEMKSSEIMDQLLEPPAQRTLKKDLLELKKLGLINFRGQARATTWFLIKKG